MFGFLLGKKTDDFSKDVMKHVDALYTSALRLCRNPADAEDIVQETLVRAFRFRHTYTEGTNRRAWLFKILHNTFINDYHHRKDERFHVDAHVDLSEVEDRLFAEFSGSSQGQTPVPFSGEMSDEVRRAFESLPADYRAVVDLVDLQEFSYAETAQIIGHPVGTVMSRLNRGRGLLKKALQEYAEREGFIPRSLSAETVPDGKVTSITESRRKTGAR